MANLVLSLLTVVASRAKANFVRQTRQTAKVQERFLLELIQAHRNTELGRKYKLGEIKTVEQFREQIPILPYSIYEPYLERIAQGEQNILTADRVVYITLTSGSMGKKKNDSHHKAIAKCFPTGNFNKFRIFKRSFAVKRATVWQTSCH